MISIELEEKPDNNWNSRLGNSEFGTIYQTKEYAYAKNLLGANPLFLKFINNAGSVLGQLLILKYPRYDKKGIFGKVLKKIPKTHSEFCKWTYGPVIFNKDSIPKIHEALNNFLISKKCRVLGSEHPLSDVPLTVIGKPFKIKTWSTFLLDLRKGRQSLWNKIDKHSAQKNIERSQERGVQIKKMEKSDYVLYRKMALDIKNIDSELPVTTLEKQWDSLQKVGYTGFFAYENDVPIGGISISYFNGYLNEFNIVRTSRDYSEKLYSQDLLKWKIIEWGIDNKFRYYDLSGINPNPSNKKELGIFRYKKKWGGDLKNYPVITI